MSAKDADAYLAKLSAEKRATLEKVRKAIRAAAPGAVEGMSYGMPAFIQGKPIAGYSASATHCSYFPMSGTVTAALADDLKAYEVSKGGFRFAVGKPPPAALVRKLVRTRLAEIAAGGKPKAKKQASAAKTAEAAAAGHALQKEIAAASKTILGVSPAISAGVKWNAPSFRTEKDWFATVNLRSTDALQLILHLGAKKRADLKPFKIADPNGLMRWLDKDRALVTLGKGAKIAANRTAFAAIVRAWIKQL